MVNAKVWLVGAGPGDPDLIAVRGLEILRRADVVLHDTLVHPALLEECRPDATVIDVGKRYGGRSTPEEEIIRLLIEHARAGRSTVRLKGGDPFLFARGAEETEALAASGIPFGIVPGISSPVGTTAFAGIPLTHRDVSSSVTFITGSDRAGRPWCAQAWQRLATATDTLCILMGMRRIEEITTALMEGGRAADTPAAVIHRGARCEQRVLVGTLGGLAAQVSQTGFSNPGLIVVGDVVRFRERLRWFDVGPLFGKRLLLARAAEQQNSSADELRRRGAAAVPMPLISIEDPPEPQLLRLAVRRLHAYDWILVTSANGARRLCEAVTAEGLDARAFATAKIGAIGPKTAEALSPLGLKPDLVAEQHVAEGLVADLLGRGAIGRALLVRALEARDVLPDQLSRAGVQVDVVAAYQTRQLSEQQGPQLRSMLLAGDIDAVLVTSSSMANALADALGDRARELLSGTVVASIGPVTTETLRRAGLDVQVVARTFTIAGILDALEEYFANRPRTSS